MRVYLYGAISGNANDKKDFCDAHDHLYNWSSTKNNPFQHSFSIRDPVIFNRALYNSLQGHTEWFRWKMCMLNCIDIIKTCTHFYQVNNFDPHRSGARIEEYYFKLYGLKELTPW